MIDTFAKIYNVLFTNVIIIQKYSLVVVIVENVIDIITNIEFLVVEYVAFECNTVKNDTSDFVHD